MQKTDKLISANALLEKVQFRIDTPGIIGSTVRDVVATTRRIIEEAPAVDAVEVIRCKDCRFWAHEFDTVGHCTYAGIDLDHAESGFCSYGERRSTDGS